MVSMCVCVPKFCYLGNTLGVGGGVEEAARTRVRCAWAKFEELFPILKARGASFGIKGKIYKAWIQECIDIWDWNLGDESVEQTITFKLCFISVKCNSLPDSFEMKRNTITILFLLISSVTFGHYNLDKQSCFLF